MSYFIPEWEVPKVLGAVVQMVSFFDHAYGRIPLVVALPLDDELAAEAGLKELEFLYIRDDDGKLYYESMIPIETNGVVKPLRVEVCMCGRGGH